MDLPRFRSVPSFHEKDSDFSSDDEASITTCSRAEGEVRRDSRCKNSMNKFVLAHWRHIHRHHFASKKAHVVKQLAQYIESAEEFMNPRSCRILFQLNMHHVESRPYLASFALITNTLDIYKEQYLAHQRFLQLQKLVDEDTHRQRSMTEPQRRKKRKKAQSVRMRKRSNCSFSSAGAYIIKEVEHISPNFLDNVPLLYPPDFRRQ